MGAACSVKGTRAATLETYEFVVNNNVPHFQCERIFEYLVIVNTRSWRG